MNLLINLILGGFIGWVASLIMKTDAQQGWVANVIVGIVGSVLGSAIYTLVKYGSANFSTQFLAFTPIGLIVSILGAVALIFLLGFFRR